MFDRIKKLIKTNDVPIDDIPKGTESPLELKDIQSLIEADKERKQKAFREIRQREEANFISNVDPTKYVVLDVETNGLSAKVHDLLSIAIYKPDTETMYHKFLPLEMNEKIFTTEFNGITMKMLKGAMPLSQKDVNDIIETFELETRTVLTYGSLDEKFLRMYFLRHRLSGFDKLRFYNFKHDVVSSRFSEGNITKDNLCKIFLMDNVSQVHSAENDCVLEWKLYARMNGGQLLITNNKVFEFKIGDYIIPASMISTFPNFKYHLPPLPRIKAQTETIKVVKVIGGYLKKFPTNFNGDIIENLINGMLGVKRIYSMDFLKQNKSKLKYVGTLESKIDRVPLIINEDGTVSTIRPQDVELGKELNAFVEALRKDLEPLIEFIRTEVFQGEEIMSQELVVHEDKNVLAFCDLSSKSAVMEIKATNYREPENYANQIYYEAKGREAYLLQVEWGWLPKELHFIVTKMNLDAIDPIDGTSASKFEEAKGLIETENVELKNYVNKSMPTVLRCKKCGYEWNSSFRMAIKHTPCPKCFPKMETSKRKPKAMTEEEFLEKRARKFYERIREISDGRLQASNYVGSKDMVHVKCLGCGYEWDVRADHLIQRCHCKNCR